MTTRDGVDARDVAAAVKAASGVKGWTVCRGCGELYRKSGVCLDCTRFVPVVPSVEAKSCRERR